MRLHEALLIGFGGALGALVRAGLVRFCEQRLNWALPWPVLLVNVLGCFLVGCLAGALAREPRFDTWLRPLLGVGFLGGFTTYSAFAQESLSLLRTGAQTAAIGSIGLHLVLGLLAAYLGSSLCTR
jgi:CrcB protein